VKLTKQLVNSKRRGPASDRSRERLFDAAKHEFAAHGFAGASVDRIAAAARLNKAMIYYHFGSKAALYREILREMFAAVGARVTTVVASAATPAEKIRLFVEAFAAEAEARPHFPPIWFREIAEGGQHLDAATIGDMAAVLKALVAIIDEGVRLRRFTPTNPLLVHAGIIAPVLLFFASVPLRKRIAKAGMKAATSVQKAEVIAHIQRVTLGLLEGRV
jgi:TetR/AcrR family transcriptional regulator